MPTFDVECKTNNARNKIAPRYSVFPPRARPQLLLFSIGCFQLPSETTFPSYLALRLLIEIEHA
jgi:hypothetical protein